MPRRTTPPSFATAQTSGYERRVVPGTDAPLSGGTLCREVIGPWTVAPGSEWVYGREAGEPCVSCNSGARVHVWVEVHAVRSRGRGMNRTAVLALSHLLPTGPRGSENRVKHPAH